MIAYFKSMDNDTLMEIFAVTLSIGTFWIGARQYIITWPINIAISCINIPLHYSSQLYDRCLLNIISIISSCYGWYRWRYGGEGSTKLARISQTSLQEGTAILAISPFYMALLYGVLVYVHAKIPFSSAFCNTLCMIGMWMTANKKVETYIVWFLVNVISIYVFYQVQRPFFIIKHSLYLILSVKSYLLWRTQYEKQLSPSIKSQPHH